MLLRKKGQSTAEYAIIIGLVIAVAAGVLQLALKSGIRQKNKQATDYLLNAGQDNADFIAGTANTAETYSQDYRETTVDSAAYVDESVLEKGGSEKKYQKQKSTTQSINVESINKVQ